MTIIKKQVFEGRLLFMLQSAKERVISRK